MSLELVDVVLPLTDFALEVSAELRARTTALFGPSGAGKTTLLEVIAGLRTPRSGRVALHGRTVFDAARKIDVPPRLRRIGYVPQDDALFPHLSVRQNLSYGATREHPYIVDVLELAPFLDRGVRQLSGGERKRVSLARALFSEPEVLLLDEPLAGIDEALRDRVLEYLIRVRDEFPIPMLYVTHHRPEVEALCEEMVILERGRIAAIRAIATQP